MIPIYVTDHGSGVTTTSHLRLTDHQQFLDHVTERFPSRDPKQIAAVIGLFLYLSQQSYPTGFDSWAALLAWAETPAGMLLLSHAEAELAALLNRPGAAADYLTRSRRELIHALHLRYYYGERDIARLTDQELEKLGVFGRELWEWPLHKVLALLACCIRPSYTSEDLASTARVIWGDDDSGK